jgi:hypothetical protein
MREAFIRRMATGRPGRSTKRNARGHRDDRLRRTVPLPPFPEQERETGKYSPSPPLPTGISNNKGLEIENIAVTLCLAPTSVPSIDTAQ